MTKDEIYGKICVISVLVDAAIEHGFLDGSISDRIRNNVEELKDNINKDLMEEYYG